MKVIELIEALSTLNYDDEVVLECTEIDEVLGATDGVASVESVVATELGIAVLKIE